MSYKLKLTSPGGETRRLTFSTQPLWLDLEQKIASLFDIQSNAVAVSYEDGDGDIITMSSQDELEDYFQTTYKPDQIIKLSVVDKSNARNATQRSASAFVEDLDETPQGDLPTMGPTMFIEVDDGGWQCLPRIPEIFSIPEEGTRAGPGEGHAFVEVLDSDVEKGNDPVSSERTPNGGISTRQLRHKGKQKASLDTEATKSTSSASIIDDDFPTKPSVHVYDVSDAGRSPMAPSQGLPEGRRPGGPGVETLMGSFGTVYPASPPQDAFKEIPHARDILGAGERDRPHDAASIHSESARSAQHMAGGASLQDFGNTVPGGDETSGSRTPTLQQIPPYQPSLVHDVANLMDDMTSTFASHPELSEGVRNIIRNAVGGRYWSTERDRIAGISENVRVAAEETSSRITQAAGNMANTAERDAVRMIAEALGGVFRVIGELSGGDTAARSSTDQRSVPSGAPPAPATGVHHRFSQQERAAHYPTGWNGPSHVRGVRPRGWDWHHFRDHHGPRFESEYRPQPGIGPWQPVPTAPQAHRNSTWGPGVYPTNYFDEPVNDGMYGGTNRPNLHETKAHLEAAKAVYKAEKERFRQEKEERRRQRRESIQKKPEDSRVQQPDGTIREEEIVARLPLHRSSQVRSSRNPFADSYGIPPHPSNSGTGVATSRPPLQAAVLSPRKSVPGTGTSFYSTVDPIPTVPPAPIPVPVSAVSTVSTAPPVPPPPPVPTNFGASAPAFSVNVAQTQPPPMPTRGSAVGSTLGPYPWPMPPARDPLRRRHLTTLRERIQARLFDMGITPASQPDMLDIVNTCTSRTDSPDDDEVLADVLSAMDMGGSPSPRAGTSRLSH